MPKRISHNLITTDIGPKIFKTLKDNFVKGTTSTKLFVQFADYTQIWTETLNSITPSVLGGIVLILYPKKHLQSLLTVGIFLFSVSKLSQNHLSLSPQTALTVQLMVKSNNCASLGIGITTAIISKIGEQWSVCGIGREAWTYDRLIIQSAGKVVQWWFASFEFNATFEG